MGVLSVFDLKKNNTSIKSEVNAGITTWITMVYIVVVNPAILANAGMDFGAVFVATCLAASVGSAFMAGFANYPIALAPGMGLNAFFAFSIVLGSGYSWESALGAVFVSGVIFFFLSIFGLRERVIDAIPRSIKTGSAIGIGFFLAIIGFQNSGIVEQGQGTLLSLGDLKSVPACITFFGFVVIVALHVREKPWCVFAGVTLSTLLAWYLEGTSIGVPVSMPPSIIPTFSQLAFDMPLDIAFATVVLSLLLVDMFDTSGTLVAVGRAGNMEVDGKLPRLKRAMVADSLATVAGSILGTSTTTSYIESNAGIAVGGRTGLTAAVVAVLFLLTLFLYPIVSKVPVYATASALIYVSILLIKTFRDFDEWEDFAETAPLVTTALVMPMSFSISDGLGAGVLVFVLVRLLTGRFVEVNPIVGALAAVFLMRFMFL